MGVIAPGIDSRGPAGVEVVDDDAHDHQVGVDGRHPVLQSGRHFFDTVG